MRVPWVVLVLIVVKVAVLEAQGVVAGPQGGDQTLKMKISKAS
jgi:hypothetical protein